MNPSKKRKAIIFGLFGVIFGLGVTYPYLRFEFRKKYESNCFVQGHHPRRVLPSWGDKDGLEVFFSAQGGNNCICPHYPAIGVYSKRPIRWIQVVEVNIPNPKLGMELGWDLHGKSVPWIFSDTTGANRKLALPFYSNNNTSQPFWDHPCWSYGSDLYRLFSFGQPITWQARLYAVRVRDSLIQAEAGLGWGWQENSKLKINAIEPSVLSPKQWNKDLLLLERIYKQWKFSRYSLNG